MKPLLQLADYAAAIVMGLGTLFLVSAVVNDGWNMFLAMGAGMLLGVLVLVSTLLLFIRISTPFHIIPVGMIITMVIGMTVGMKFSAGFFNSVSMIPAVTLFSFVCQLVINRYDRKLQGEVPLETGD